MSMPRALVASLVLLGGCATAEEVQALDQKVTELEKKVAALEARPAGSGAAAVDPKQEQAAQALYKEIDGLIREGDMTGAQTKMKELSTKYAATTTFKRARKTATELEVVGKAVPDDWTGMIETWYQGEGEIDLKSGATLMVFWEVWCPHCKREVPKLMETHANWSSKGMKVVGFTRITKSATEEKVKEFMAEQKVSYPVAKEKGELARTFNVGGIPAAAIVKDGKVVWRGHPARLNDEMIGKLIGA